MKVENPRADSAKLVDFHLAILVEAVTVSVATSDDCVWRERGWGGCDYPRVWWCVKGGGSGRTTSPDESSGCGGRIGIGSKAIAAPWCAQLPLLIIRLEWADKGASGTIDKGIGQASRLSSKSVQHPRDDWCCLWEGACQALLGLLDLPYNWRVDDSLASPGSGLQCWQHCFSLDLRERMSTSHQQAIRQVFLQFLCITISFITLIMAWKTLAALANISWRAEKPCVKDCRPLSSSSDLRGPATEGGTNIIMSMVTTKPAVNIILIVILNFDG